MTPYGATAGSGSSLYWQTMYVIDIDRQKATISSRFAGQQRALKCTRHLPRLNIAIEAAKRPTTPTRMLADRPSQLLIWPSSNTGCMWKKRLRTRLRYGPLGRGTAFSTNSCQNTSTSVMTWLASRDNERLDRLGCGGSSDARPR
jgi:hypothetical protein